MPKLFGIAAVASMIVLAMAVVPTAQADPLLGKCRLMVDWWEDPMQWARATTNPLTVWGFVPDPTQPAPTPVTGDWRGWLNVIDVCTLVNEKVDCMSYWIQQGDPGKVLICMFGSAPSGVTTMVDLHETPTVTTHGLPSLEFARTYHFHE